MSHSSKPHNPSDKSETKPAPPRRKPFPSILTTVVVDTTKVDLKSVRSWLTTFLGREYPQHDRFIAALVMDRIGNNKYPDGKLLQVELSGLGLLPLEQIDRIMRKLWSKMDKDMTRVHEKHVEKYQKISTPQGSTTRLSASSSNLRSSPTRELVDVSYGYRTDSWGHYESDEWGYSSSSLRYPRSSSDLHHDSRVYYLQTGR